MRVGAADARAQIAAFVYAVQALVHAGIRRAGEVVLAFVVDEEPGACSPYGTHSLLEQALLTGDAAMIGEPGDQKMAIGHRGLYRFRLVIQGEATHTGIKAWEQGLQGRNAILDLARLTLALAASPLPATPSAAFPSRRSVLTFPTLVRGGSATSIVPGACEAWGEARLLPGLSPEDVKRLMIVRLAQLDITHSTLEDLVVVPAVEISSEAEIVQALARAAEAITGTRPRLAGSGPTCDGWMFVTRGIPTICGYGVAGGGVHGADEWVDPDSLLCLTQIYAEAMIRYLGTEEQTT